MPDEPRHRFGIDDRIGVDRDDDLARGLGQPVIERRGLAAIGLLQQAHAAVVAEIILDEFGGAVGRAVVDDQHFEAADSRTRAPPHRIDDHRFFVIRRDQDRDTGLVFRMIERRRAQLLDQRQHADNQRASADQQNSRDKDERDSLPQQAEHVENERVDARHQPFPVREAA